MREWFWRLKIIIWFFPTVITFGIGFNFFLKLPWYLYPIISLICTCIVFLFFKLLFDAINAATGHTSTIVLRERLAGDVERARYLKRTEKYDDAFQMIESVLIKDPDSPEALYLKGQILLEGFGLRDDARRILLKVMTLVTDKESLYHRAMNCRKDITD